MGHIGDNRYNPVHITVIVSPNVTVPTYFVGSPTFCVTQNADLTGCRLSGDPDVDLSVWSQERSRIAMLASDPGGITSPLAGDVLLFAVYDHALSFSETQQNFRAGPPQAAPQCYPDTVQW